MNMPKPALSPSHQKCEDGIKPRWFHISSEGDLEHKWADDANTFGQGPEGKAGTDWHELIDPREWVLLRLHQHMRGVGSDLWRVYGGIEYSPEPGQDAAKVSLNLIIEFIISETERERLGQVVRSLGVTGAEVNVMHEAFDEPNKDQVEVIFPILGKSFAEVCALQLALLNDPDVMQFGLVSVL